MEPRYVAFRSPAGCLTGLLAVLVAFVAGAFAFKFGLPKWAWIAIIIPSSGLVLAIALVLDRRRVDRERSSAPGRAQGRRWFVIFLIVSVSSGALAIAGLTPMMRKVSDLGRVGLFLLGIGIATIFSRGVMGILERLGVTPPRQGIDET